MKKLLALASIVFISGFAFAQNSKYSELLSKAKDYESKNQLIYAMGYYYDAAREDPSRAKEAEDRFNAIADAFRKGKPGLKASYTVFDTQAEFYNQIKNADKYWTEFYPQVWKYNFEFIKGPANLKNRTATYYVKVAFAGRSKKFTAIMKPFVDGLHSAWTHDWAANIPYEWPLNSIVYDESEGYEKTGIAIYSGFKSVENNSKKNSKTGKTEYSYDYKHLPYFASWIMFENALTYDSKRKNRFDAFTKEGHVFDRELKDDVYSLCDLTFDICNSDGRVLVPVKQRTLVNTRYSTLEYENVEWKDWPVYSLTINNVDEDAMNAIDSKKALVKLTGIYLQHGKPEDADFDAAMVRGNYNNGSIKNPRFKKSCLEVTYSQRILDSAEIVVGKIEKAQ